MIDEKITDETRVPDLMLNFYELAECYDKSPENHRKNFFASGSAISLSKEVVRTFTGTSPDNFFNLGRSCKLPGCFSTHAAKGLYRRSEKETQRRF
jgi:hypothetical protein